MKMYAIVLLNKLCEYKRTISYFESDKRSSPGTDKRASRGSHSISLLHESMMAKLRSNARSLFAGMPTPALQKNLRAKFSIFVMFVSSDIEPLSGNPRWVMGCIA